jgi:putative phosphoesterase
VPLSAFRVGVVSDTHGFFDPKLALLLRGARLILHAGDICGVEVLEQLSTLAPVQAIYGNCDADPLTAQLPPWRIEQIGAFRVLVLHDLGGPTRPRQPAQKLIEQVRPTVVVSGHSHQSNLEVVDGVFFVNPGSAGKKRFKLIRSAAVLLCGEDSIDARVYSLETDVPKVIARKRFRMTSTAPLYRSDPGATMAPDQLGRRGHTAGASKRMPGTSK